MTQTATLEVESSAEKLAFPVKPARVGMVEAVGKYVDNLPQGGFSSHEGLIAVKEDGKESVYMMKASEAARKQLEADGLVDFASNYGVPYTGAESGDRMDAKFAYKEALLEYNEAAVAAGLKELDYTQVSDEQKAALDSIGFLDTGVNGVGLLSEKKSFTVSSAWDTDSYGVNAERAAPENVGTYAVVTVPHSDRFTFEAVALTDQQGREVIAPKNETLSGLLDSLGYREVETPTFDTVTSLTYADNEFGDGKARAKNDKIRAFMGSVPSDTLQEVSGR